MLCIIIEVLIFHQKSSKILVKYDWCKGLLCEHHVQLMNYVRSIYYIDKAKRLKSIVLDTNNLFTKWEKSTFHQGKCQLKVGEFQAL